MRGKHEIRMLPAYLRLIDTKTKGRYDVLPLFKDFSAFRSLVSDLAKLVEDCEFEYVAGIDALGFILGTALAFRMEVGFVAIRKAGKLPKSCARIEFEDYTKIRKGLELAPGVLSPGDRILLVDEWIETGAQARAAAQLIEAQGAMIAAITGIAIERNERTRDLFQRYRCRPLTDGELMEPEV